MFETAVLEGVIFFPFSSQLWFPECETGISRWETVGSVRIVHELLQEGIWSEQRNQFHVGEMFSNFEISQSLLEDFHFCWVCHISLQARHWVRQELPGFCSHKTFEVLCESSD